MAAVLELELPWQQAGEAEEAAGGRVGGGASAVEAGQSCSRHQGRHFLCGEIETREISDDTRPERTHRFCFHVLFSSSQTCSV